MFETLKIFLGRATNRSHFVAALFGCIWIAGGTGIDAVWAQSSKKPTRVRPPVFSEQDFKDIFFEDVSSVLKGELPKTRSSLQVSSGNAPSSEASGDSASELADTMAWKSIISPTTLEDLIKGSKLRLDKIVTTPAAFAGGGFVEARKEFSLQALLFAIIETYPGEVRWKASSSNAREAMARVAANTKVGSRQVYDESKKRLLDLSDLLNGTAMQGEAKTEIVWENLIDRVPLMQLLDWANTDYVSTYSANESQFNANKEELQRYAELIAVLGRASLFENMPDASDADYVTYGNEMIAQAQQVSVAVKSGNADLARQASSQLQKSCNTCHENFK